MSNLKLENISFNYNNKPALFSNLELTFEAHKFHCLIGSNGSGKTTLLKLIAGALKQQKGSIFWNDKKLDTAKEQETLIGYIPQTYSLDSEMKVLDTLLFIGSLQKIDKKRLKKRISDLCTELKLTPHLNKRVKQLSGGQKQLLNISIGLLHDPDIILLDEPFTGLDFSTKTNVLGCLKSLDKLIICITHDLNVAQANADTITLIENGNKTVVEAPKTLIDLHPFLLYEVDFKAIGEPIQNDIDNLPFKKHIVHSRALIYAENTESNKQSIDNFLSNHSKDITHIEFSSNNLYSTLLGKYNYISKVKSGKANRNKKRK